MNSKILLTAWSLVAAAMAAPDLAAAQAQVSVAGADSLGGLIARQTASDRMNIELDQVVRAAVARGVAERTSMSARRPIQNYLEAVKSTVAEPTDASVTPPPLAPEAIAPLVEKHLRRMEEAERDNLAQDATVRGEVETYANAKTNGVAIKLRTAAAIESWSRLVVIDPPGEVIENDPIDVAHARLEDLTRRREELQSDLKTKPTSLAMRSILLELAGIDRQIDAAIFRITGVVWRQQAGLGGICFPKPQPGRPVPVFNCHYLANDMPMRVDPNGEDIVVDKVLLDLDEDGRGGLRKARLAYYTRGAGQPPSTEATFSVTGEVLYASNGTAQIAYSIVDSDGEEREVFYPLEPFTQAAKGKFPGFSGHGPFKFTFRRDPKSYVTWEDAQLIAQGKAPKNADPWADLAPLEPAEDDFLAPLVVEPGRKPPAPAPPPPPPPPPPAADFDPDMELAPLEPGPGDDAYLPPITKPD
ncbi:MAG: hypothetical protein KBC34_08795 [Phenylobacterium sp.]|nr:hypothetical protein [Phenylobacterium sp.]